MLTSQALRLCFLPSLTLRRCSWPSPSILPLLWGCLASIIPTTFSHWFGKDLLNERAGGDKGQILSNVFHPSLLENKPGDYW